MRQNLNAGFSVRPRQGRTWTLAKDLLNDQNAIDCHINDVINLSSSHLTRSTPICIVEERLNIYMCLQNTQFFSHLLIVRFQIIQFYVLIYIKHFITVSDNNLFAQNWWNCLQSWFEQSPQNSSCFKYWITLKRDWQWHCVINMPTIMWYLVEKIKC